MAHPFNILYVDDEQYNLIAFTASFRRHYNIFTAQSGQEAIQVMYTQAELNQPIHLIISDQRMPAMTGVELLEKLLPDFPDTIRMVLTAYSDLESTINAINKGKVYQFINKPWNAEELKVVMDKALEYYSLRMENRSLQEERMRLLIQAERQEKQNILSRFETLKNQVNPHFLFNSLNALSSLVYKNPEAARDFIQKLSNVYRYIIEQRDSDLVELREELNFVRAYFFLHKIRFGENLHLVETNLESWQQNYFTPPLALQLLVENAIKHNIVSSEQPLTIELYMEEGGQLVVRNNFQKRTNGTISTGIGLQNLKERYSFFSESQPSFYQEDGYFYAKVPLLKQS
jgi:sensor histidine kinase YesM